MSAREDAMALLEITRVQFEKFPEDTFTSYIYSCDLARAELGLGKFSDLVDQLETLTA